jgi:hypothetical protein
MKDKKKADIIAKALHSSYYHGYAVGRKDAKSIGPDVEFPEKK